MPLDALPGTTGWLSAKQFDELMKVLAEAPSVIILNDKVPRRWETPNNDIIANNIVRYPNASLIDWHTIGTNHPEYFYKDPMPLRAVGAQAYTAAIADAVSR